MSCVQLRLLPPAQPLVERLGTDFFRTIPTCPGVYRMLDEQGNLLYVGKAANLRDRLNSYRRTHGQARRTVRLIHAIRMIEWETFETETAALLRENELIRILRPRFNRAGTWPRSARYLMLRETGSGFDLIVSSTAEGEAYGAFRGEVPRVVLAMARLLWFAWHCESRVHSLPHPLLHSEGIRCFQAEHAAATSWLEDLRGFLEGKGDNLLARLLQLIPEPDSSFEVLFLATQWELVMDFYRRGPLQGRRLRERFSGPQGAVAPEQMDDWRLMAGRPARAGGIQFDIGLGPAPANWPPALES